MNTTSVGRYSRESGHVCFPSRSRLISMRPRNNIGAVTLSPRQKVISQLNTYSVKNCTRTQ